MGDWSVRYLSLAHAPLILEKLATYGVIVVVAEVREIAVVIVSRTAAATRLESGYSCQQDEPGNKAQSYRCPAS